MSLARHVGGWAVTRRSPGGHPAVRDSAALSAPPRRRANGNEERGSSARRHPIPSRGTVARRQLRQTTRAQNGRPHPQGNRRLLPAPTACSLAAQLRGSPAAPPLRGRQQSSMTPLSWPWHRARTSPGRSPQLREARWGVSTTRPHSPALALKHQGVRQALTVLPARRSRPPMTFPPLRRPQPAWTPPRHVHTSTFLPP